MILMFPVFPNDLVWWLLSYFLPVCVGWVVSGRGLLAIFLLLWGKAMTSTAHGRVIWTFVQTDSRVPQEACSWQQVGGRGRKPRAPVLNLRH